MPGPFSYLQNLICSSCATICDADVVQGLCSCHAPLRARYDLAALRDEVPTPDFLATRSPDLWRYHELLPVRDPARIVTMGEGMTPLIPLTRLGRELGTTRLLLKDEGLLPTGTFKARGAAVGISRAHELGVRRVAMPTNGNAGAAWAAYAARAGIEATIVMPADAPPATRAECLMYGARLYLIDGLIGDASAALRPLVQGEHADYFDVSTLKEPYRIEGKKTMGLELAEQLNWHLPDVIVYPTGGGVGLIGMHKAFKELQELGWVSDPLPRLVAVQADGCAPIVRAFHQRAERAEPWVGSRTVAFGINVPTPVGDAMILQALYESGGTAVAVSDSDLLKAQRQTAEREGCFICPEGAAAVQAVRVLLDAGWLEPDASIVVLNTGSGVKYTDLVAVDVPKLSAGQSIATG